METNGTQRSPAIYNSSTLEDGQLDRNMQCEEEEWTLVQGAQRRQSESKSHTMPALLSGGRGHLVYRGDRIFPGSGGGGAQICVQFMFQTFQATSTNFLNRFQFPLLPFCEFLLFLQFRFVFQKCSLGYMTLAGVTAQEDEGRPRRGETGQGSSAATLYTCIPHRLFKGVQSGLHDPSWGHSPGQRRQAEKRRNRAS
jgi:hypothetical protein